MTDIINYEVKDNKPHIEHKNIVQQLKKKFVPTSLEEIQAKKDTLEQENKHIQQVLI